jgi:integrase/recombinase XerD
MTAKFTWSQALTLWKAKLEIRSAATAHSSTVPVKLFFEKYGVELADLTTDHLELYVIELAARMNRRAKDPLASATVNKYIEHLRQFLLFAFKKGWLSQLTPEQISSTLIAIPAHVERPYQIVTGEEVDRLLEAAEADPRNGVRDQALIALALLAGLRTSEIVHLNIGDITSDGVIHEVHIKAGKGRKDRPVQISQDVFESVHRWAAGKAADQLLFPISAERAREIVKECAKRAGLEKRITPMSLRHSYAIRLLTGDPETGQGAAPIQIVSKLMGHADLATTSRYLDHFDRQTMAQYAPKMRKKKE